MGGLLIFCSEFNQNLPGRSIAHDLRPRKIYCMLFAGFVDGLESYVEEIHLRENFTWVTPSGELERGRVGCCTWPERDLAGGESGIPGR